MENWSHEGSAPKCRGLFFLLSHFPICRVYFWLGHRTWIALNLWHSSPVSEFLYYDISHCHISPFILSSVLAPASLSTAAWKEFSRNLRSMIQKTRLVFCLGWCSLETESEQGHLCTWFIEGMLSEKSSQEVRKSGKHMGWSCGFRSLVSAWVSDQRVQFSFQR